MQCISDRPVACWTRLHAPANPPGASAQASRYASTASGARLSPSSAAPRRQCALLHCGASRTASSASLSASANRRACAVGQGAAQQGAPVTAGAGWAAKVLQPGVVHKSLQALLSHAPAWPAHVPKRCTTCTAGLGQCSGSARSSDARALQYASERLLCSRRSVSLSGWSAMASLYLQHSLLWGTAAAFFRAKWWANPMECSPARAQQEWSRTAEGAQCGG